MWKVLDEIGSLDNIDIHSFMHNILTLQTFDPGYGFFYDMEDLEDYDPSSYYTKEGNKIINQMIKSRETKRFDQAYLIEHLK